MVATAHRSRRTRQGFTLIEILVIAALIALLSGLAIISIQYLVDSSKRKASIADANAVSSALTAAHIDLGFFPMVGYLSHNRQELVDGGMLAVMNFNAPAPLYRQGFDRWNGPYLPGLTGRERATVGGQGGRCRLRVTRTEGAYNPDDHVILDWPADPWGLPYVVYLVKLDRDPQAGVSFPDWVQAPTEDPDLYAMVVSYGPNQVPGGRPDERLPADVIEQAEEYFLFRREWRDQSDADFVALTFDEYYEDNNGNPQNRLFALTRDYDAPPDGYMLSVPEFPGVMDDGSDDIMVHLK